MAYLCVSNDCKTRAVNENISETLGAQETLQQEHSRTADLLESLHQANKAEFVIPDYVCCVLTEGVWTIFGASVLIIGLFTIATLKYFKKYLAKTKYIKKNLRMKDR